MASVGYIRVSSVGQNCERQLADIKLDEVFEDCSSGSSTNRPALQECLTYLRKGDILYVHSIDRLARNLADLKKTVDLLTTKGVGIHFCKEQLYFSPDRGLNPIHQFTFHMMGAFAEFERSMIKERQAEGIAARKAKGKHCGRPSKLSPQGRLSISRRLDANEAHRWSPLFGQEIANS